MLLFQSVEKPLSLIKKGCRVLLALLVLHRAKLLASNQSILALGRSPRQGLGAVAPHSAPARMPGVYAQGLCTMQSQPSIHSPSPRGRGLGLGIENSYYLIKKQFFSTSCMCHSIPLRHIFYMYFTQKNEKLLLIEKKCTIILTIAQKAHKNKEI